MKINPRTRIGSISTFPRFHGKIYISYKEIGNNDLNKLVNDAYNMTYKHSTRATEIVDSAMRTNGVGGVFFQWVAMPLPPNNSL